MAAATRPTHVSFVSADSNRALNHGFISGVAMDRTEPSVSGQITFKKHGRLSLSQLNTGECRLLKESPTRSSVLCLARDDIIPRPILISTRMQRSKSQSEMTAHELDRAGLYELCQAEIGRARL